MGFICVYLKLKYSKYLSSERIYEDYHRFFVKVHQMQQLKAFPQKELKTFNYYINFLKHKVFTQQITLKYNFISY